MKAFIIKIRFFAVLMLIMSMALTASGCGTADGGADEEGTDPEEPKSIEVYAMDTYMTLTAYGENADDALSDAEAEIKRIDTMFSTGNEDRTHKVPPLISFPIIKL